MKAYKITLLASFLSLSLIPLFDTLIAQEAKEVQKAQNTQESQLAQEVKAQQNAQKQETQKIQEKVRQEIAKMQQEQKEEQKESESPIMQNDLNYLFDTNFPLDDYTYKAKRAPKYLTKESLENLENAKNEIPIQDSKEDIRQKAEATATTLQESIKKQEKESVPQKILHKSSQANAKPLTREQHLNTLLRDSILAERGNMGTYFSQQNSIYGDSKFSNQENINTATNEHKLFRMVRAGRLIPAILTSAISSDLSGIVSAQIEEDIYATMGRAVMIPRGSKVIGSYQSSREITGHARLQIAWREIITPQGVNILLTDANTADSMGMSGVEGYLNNRYLERFGIPYAISTLSNVLLLSIATRDGATPSPYSESIYTQSQTDLSSIVQEILQQQRAIKPTIEIKAGSRIFIVPTHHIWFPKPRNNEIMAQYFKD